VPSPFLKENVSSILLVSVYIKMLIVQLAGRRDSPHAMPSAASALESRSEWPAAASSWLISASRRERTTRTPAETAHVVSTPQRRQRCAPHSRRHHRKFRGLCFHTSSGCGMWTRTMGAARHGYGFLIKLHALRCPVQNYSMVTAAGCLPSDVARRQPSELIDG
jgi:hypothetical protein